MATMYGITGKLSGKMGSAVFRVREGQQVVTQYNPIVKNPNTAGQQTQRAKFKLMSQLAAVMSPAMGSFIIKVRPEGGKPSKRNAFTQANFPLVDVVSEDQQVTAKIHMEQVKLTSSFRHLPSLKVSYLNDNINIDLATDPAADVTTIRTAVVGYEGDVPVVLDIRDTPVSSLPALVELPEGKYTVLAYGLIPSESAKATIDLDNIHTPADDDFISAVELDAMVAEGSMVETMTVGANISASA